MNTATKNLEDDHVHILRLIDVMDFISGSDNPDISHLETIVEIIRNFADGYHHAKEEDLFFPLLVRNGFSTTQGPVAVMLHEHTEGRNFVRGMARNIDLFKNGDRSVLSEIYLNMNGYAELLRNHISKENNILFRMADKALSESDQNDLLVRFKEIEKDQEISSNPMGYINKIEELASYYKI
jgi:hemerythrin-like domain-containing protein